MPSFARDIHPSKRKNIVRDIMEWNPWGPCHNIPNQGTRQQNKKAQFDENIKRNKKSRLVPRHFTLNVHSIVH